MSTTSKPTTAFWVITVIALLWNLSGLMAFFMDAFMSPEVLAALPDPQRELYESTPAWLKVVYGIAVFGGTIGCILLLLKKSLAIQLFIVSLVAIAIQMLYSLFLSKAVEVHGIASIIMPICVIAIGIFLVWYAKRAKTKGWVG